MILENSLILLDKVNAIPDQFHCQTGVSTVEGLPGPCIPKERENEENNHSRVSVTYFMVPSATNRYQENF